MKIKKLLLFLFFVCFSCGALSADGSFVLKKESNEVSSHETENQIDENVIYVRNISGVGESLEIAKKDAIQNAMRFGVGELLVSKEELNNDELSQEIMNYSNAYVLDYQQISEVNDGGIYKVQADVKLEKNKVLGTLSKLNINALDLSSGVLKNYVEDKIDKKENAKRLIENEIIEPFENGNAYDIEILDIQPLTRSDLMKARLAKREYTFKEFLKNKTDTSDVRYKADVPMDKIDELFVAKVKFKMNDGYVKNLEKILGQFSEKLSKDTDEFKISFKVNSNPYIIIDEYILKEFFNKKILRMNIYGFVLRLIDSNDEIWIRKCGSAHSWGEYMSIFGTPERQFVSEYLNYAFELKKLKKLTEKDKKNGIEYYYDEVFNYHFALIEKLSPIRKIRKGYDTHAYLDFNTKERIFYIIIQLDQQDSANSKKIEFDLLYTPENECNIKE
ncbi:MULTISPECIES: viral A-type inclusion protein [unclassified Campylobacter]|uniref:viral A-type inclusion protein n=1 Tax=unclassified Campylobacter TaxID=2593542 RepID=UPI0022E99AF6|nr:MULTISPECIES: viral A-type inclusion protein [unclassified Campylobacter]MDA3043961.1 viral A-type inclusion protein [Campylobacter sp. JMF_09 ED2]MDA3045530.1 viral A-type inclusion protein [Campylobacter sp. JMF_07 ED4]MDA3064625.1 viral A-type inclusion protein [Campylobacter sp. JMF_11 EL3]MDA3072546.1 viral A-type inclusion protein [Campylobacter sp. VBCF_03 NA9]MDA3075689.1 viral A-type inclusion protein [Campylobacter sp. JMF_05 ED3]